MKELKYKVSVEVTKRQGESGHELKITGHKDVPNYYLLSMAGMILDTAKTKEPEHPFSHKGEN